MLLFAVAFLCLAVPATSAAATFAVTTTADGPVVGTCAPGEACTLRDAIAASNASADPADTITLIPGTYGLSEGELATTKSGTVTIAGPGARSTIIDGGGASRVLRADATATAISGLTVTGGVAPITEGQFPGDGGGILLEGKTLTLVGTTVTGNTATLNGAGVSAPPESGEGKTLTVETSTIAGNHVAGGTAEGLGGGIYVLGSLTMVNSTVFGNSVENPVALNEGGGVLAGPAATGGTETPTLIVNSTIAGNSVSVGTAAGFSMYNPGGATEPMSTITNTIVAANKVGEAPGDCSLGATAVSSSNDISGDASCGFTDAGSKVNTDPKLGPLANNGGQTDTLALLAGSPAIDAGTKVGCPATDQRGVARPAGTTCDIGAYEFQPVPSTPKPTPIPPTPAANSADLGVKIKVKPKMPVRGEKLAFLVTVRDAGPAAAPGVVFKGTVPAAARRPKGKGLGKKACKLGKVKKGHRTVTCRLGEITAGTARSFRVRIGTATAPKKLVVRGRVRSALADPTLKNAKAKAVAKLAS